MGQSAEFNKSEGMRNRPRRQEVFRRGVAVKGRDDVITSSLQCFCQVVYYAAVQMSMCTVPGWNSITSLVVVAAPSTDTRV